MRTQAFGMTKLWSTVICAGLWGAFLPTALLTPLAAVADATIAPAPTGTDAAAAPQNAPEPAPTPALPEPTPLPRLPTPTPAATPAPQILDPICADFHKFPETFVRLLTPESSKPGAKPAILRYDLDGDDRLESLALKRVGGNCPAQAPCLRGRAGCETLEYLNIPANSYGFGHQAEIYRKDNVLYAVDFLNKRAVSISKVKKDGRHLLCEFRDRLEKWRPPTEKSKLCRALEHNELRLVKADRPHKLSNSSTADAPDAENFILADLGGNGVQLGVIQMEFLTGAGCGCARSHLAAINAFGDELVPTQPSKFVKKENALFSRALAELTNKAEYCNTDLKWSVVEFDKKFYILASPSTQPGEWLQGRILPRQLFQWDRQKMIRLCLQEPVLSRGPAPAQLQLAPAGE